MKSRARKLALGAAMVASVAGIATSSATAATPRFDDCPLRGSDLGTCIDILSNAGSINIKGFNVPLGHSLEIRGGLSYREDGSSVFLPAVGTNGFIAEPVDVPGGVLGVDLPISLNKVKATAQLAGVPADIRIGISDLSLSVPIKLKLSNPLFSSSCTIGTNRNPVRLNLTTGTTNPPAPNRPISGSRGPFAVRDGYLYFAGNRHVDNAFAIPGASSCGFLGLGLIDGIINLKLKLPAAAGTNSIEIINDVGTRAPQ